MRLPGLLSFLLTWCLRLLGSTWRITRQIGDDGDAIEFASLMADGPVVFAFFHGQQLPMIYAHRDKGLLGMASLSGDGELLARSIDRLGYRLVRGSTSRGAAQAVRKAIRAIREEAQSPCIAVDGPRGPRHCPHRGAMGIAALATRPVVIAVAQISSTWRLSSWDRFMIPKPFARIAIRYERLAPPDGGAGVDAATEELGVAMRALLGEADR